MDHEGATRLSNPSREGRKQKIAEVAQLIEHQPSKLRVASLSLVFRSMEKEEINNT